MNDSDSDNEMPSEQPRQLLGLDVFAYKEGHTISGTPYGVVAVDDASSFSWLRPRELQLADILGKPRGPSEFTPMRDVIVPPAGVLTDAQITHRLRYPHVSHSRRNVELAQQKRSNN
ncbi:hypothetical protein NFJ02_05g119080 [Pycnococcus provasolii]